jgi:hypothetical protein
MFDWCKKKFGESKYNSPFSIKISRKNNDVHGRYYDDLNFIQINIKQHKSFIDLCDTIIHEYTHYLQNMSMYDHYFSKHSRNYDNHPYEISANKKARMYCKELRADFKKQFK